MAYKKELIVIEGEPVPKPAQTRADKWKKRPCVMRYRAWADKVRAAVGTRLERGGGGDIGVVWFLPLPKTRGGKRDESYLNRPHQRRPDADNLLKSLLDALFPPAKGGDSHIYKARIEKRYDDGLGPRTVIYREVWDGGSDRRTGCRDHTTHEREDGKIIPVSPSQWRDHEQRETDSELNQKRLQLRGFATCFLA